MFVICVQGQNSFFEAGDGKLQSTFKPGHIGRYFLYLTNGLSTLK